MKRRMDGRVRGRVAGVLFLVADVAGVLSFVSYRHQDDADYLTRAADYRDSVATGAVLVLVMTLAMVLIPVVLYPVLRERSETSAVAYVVLRTVESVVVLLGGAVIPLLVVRLSTEFVAVGAGADPALRPLGDALLDGASWSGPFGDVVWSLGFVALYYVLHRWRMVPRFLTTWGFVGVPLAVAGAVLVMFDAGPSGLAETATAVLALNELALAVWLVVKGFDRPQVLDHEGFGGSQDDGVGGRRRSRRLRVRVRGEHHPAGRDEPEGGVVVAEVGGDPVPASPEREQRAVGQE